MFSKELEDLISIACEDGVLTEKERAVLFKRGAAEGVDLEELDMVIDARLVRARQIMAARQAPPPPVPPQPMGYPQPPVMPQLPVQPQPAMGMSQPPSQPQSGKMGVVRKCPACGAPYTTGNLCCPECGHEFMGLQGNGSVERLSMILREIEARYASKDSLMSELFDQFGFSSRRQNEIITAIDTFPIPNSKEDLVEFILFLKPKANVSRFGAGKTMADIRIGEAYKRKYRECINKANFYLQQDPALFERLRSYGVEVGRKKRFGLF